MLQEYHEQLFYGDPGVQIVWSIAVIKLYGTAKYERILLLQIILFEALLILFYNLLNCSRYLCKIL